MNYKFERIQRVLAGPLTNLVDSVRERHPNARNLKFWSVEIE